MVRPEIKLQRLPELLLGLSGHRKIDLPLPLLAAAFVVVAAAAGAAIAAAAGFAGGRYLLLEEQTTEAERFDLILAPS